MVKADVMKELGELKFSELFIGENNPDLGFGLEYDIFINTTTLEVFKKENGIWDSKGFIGELNVNSDWNVNDPENPAYILNKPYILTSQMLDAIEEDLNVKIIDVETLIKELGVIDFDYNESNRTLSFIRENNEKDGDIILPVVDVSKAGFMSPAILAQLNKNTLDIQSFEQSGVWRGTFNGVSNIPTSIPNDAFNGSTVDINDFVHVLSYSLNGETGSAKFIVTNVNGNVVTWAFEMWINKVIGFATPTTAGIVRIGENIDVDENGTISTPPLNPSDVVVETNLTNYNNITHIPNILYIITDMN